MRGIIGVMAAGLPLLLGACAALPGGGHRNPLQAAGFVGRPANTLVRQAMLTRLPAHRFVRHVHGTTLSFAYADPSGCDCLYVGDARAYRRYLRRTGGLEAATDRTDLFWDWDAWGGFGPGFRWGPAMGW